MLRERNSTVLKKIIPIEVDYNVDDLAIEPDVLDRLQSEVEVIFVTITRIERKKK